MEKDFAPELITIVDDQNIEHNFEILDTIENEKGTFYALCPVYPETQDVIDDGEYIIVQAVEENGEEFIEEPDDDELLDELAEIFEKRFEELFSEE